MATSELSASLGSIKAGWSDDHGSLNVDEFLQATVVEAINQPDLDDTSEQHPYTQGLESLSATLGGKSTIISALVRNAALHLSDDVPIPGNHAERFRSTSAGIHLYCDPKTIDSDVPLFYAGLFKPPLDDGTD
ncbi:MAG: hypothetical protein Q9208_003341 [Pyrenodesmia sp. 3 TL-2023]